MNKILSKNINLLIFFLVVSLPIVSITGPFLTDLFLSLSSLLFLIYAIINRKFEYFNNIFFIIFFVWNIYLVTLSVFSDFPLLSLESSLFYFRFGVFAMCVYFLINNNNNFLKYFAISLLIVFIFVIFNSVFQYFFLTDFFGNKYDGIRLSGIFGEERILGSFLSRLSPLFLGLIFLCFNHNLKIIILSLIVFIFIDIIVYLSGERAAFFNLIFFSFILIFLTKTFKKIRIYTLIISLFFIILVSYQNKPSFDRMIVKTLTQTDILTEKPKIFSIQHQVIYSTSLKIYKDYPIFGIGPKNFREFCKKEKYKTYTIDDYSIDGCQSHAHNFYLQLLVETGPLGLMPVIFTFFSIIYLYSKELLNLLIRRKKTYDDFFIIISSSIVINLWPFIPTGSFFNNYLSFLIYLPAGFIVYIIREKKYNYDHQFN